MLALDAVQPSKGVIMPEQRTDTFVEPDAAAFRVAMGSFPTGVAIIVSGTGDDLCAMTATSLTSVSLDPLLVLVSIRSDGQIRQQIETAGSFTVNILNADQEQMAMHFAQHDRSTGTVALDQLGGFPGPAGGVLVSGALANLECSLETQYVGGDHVLFLGRVRSVHTGGAELPLVSYRSEFVSVMAKPRSENYLG
jgi:flavin reductase